ncbi:conserved hypothetical protein [Leishmania braziliensis MHOM/BR/75/M2904]|uniref:Endoplasmic reticulum transmembrane protein n=4 Tax=Viannia TaxID=37616 RepID=A4HJQ9_LEIBR|nr:conserved hypothetical protein [Leishmania braziliensis MHOM/BR/75/M2904]KAI5688010.1 hypothetical protein MNV84_06392 [Leishmania braziliensis]CCM18022.1 hypothetical protein, conserved [Leishmania guyanensis]CAJ2478091.1 unnamed protein product [Leishmania braziliensis]CAJ2478542.1 unnamed protein product [Leishmania braziliensis]CAM42726.1 conserved hypothetical protein [Leishmania braziliensis MHOM/BR/75/M2904]
MASFLSLEVNLVMVPVLVLFLLYCVPIRAISTTAERITRLVEGHSFNGFTIMSAMAIISSFSFLFHFLEWHSKYNAKQRFTDISLQLQHDNKRLRVERNMYIQLITCVLCLAVKKCAVLQARQESRQAERTADSRSTAATAHPKTA